MSFSRSFATVLLTFCLLPTSLISYAWQIPLSSTAGCKCQVNGLEAKPKDWIKSFNNLTDQLTELVGATKELTSQNAFFVIAREGPFPVVLDGVVAVVDSAEELLEELGASEPIKPGKDSDDVLEAYKASTKAALFWANVLASKGNGFKGSDIFKPVGALGESALRGILNVFENFGFAVTDYLEDRLGDVQEHGSALSRGFNDAIAQYGLIKAGVL